MLKLAWIVGLLAVVVSANPIQPDEGRIVGGFVTDISEVPYQISLQYKNKHRCGGSIIARNWVMTAAHCTEGTILDSLEVRTGSSLRNEGGNLVKIVRVFDHPQYNPITLDYDFSLLELETPIQYGLNQQAVRLTNVEPEPEEGSEVLISGWGSTQTKEDQNILRSAKVTVVNRESCNKAYWGEITSRMFCAADKRTDSCFGDSGGPLVLNGLLTGVVSWGNDCARPRYPGVYSNIGEPKIRSWINDITGL